MARASVDTALARGCVLWEAPESGIHSLMATPGNIMIALADLLLARRDALLAQWRAKVCEMPAARLLDTPTLNDHIPLLLTELEVELRANTGESIAHALASSTAHGLQRLENDFQIEEVVAEYNILRGCIHDLASEHGLVLQGAPFHVLNRVLDHAIGLALQTYSTQLALQVQQRRAEYLSFVAHDLRTPLNAISLCGKVIEAHLRRSEPSREVTQMLGALARNVQHLERLVAKVLEENQSLETEMGVHLQRRELDLWPLVEALIHDMHPVAGTDSTRLVNDVPETLQVYADAGLLRRVFQNLIANAIRYTPRGEIIISARTVADGGVECVVADNGSGIPAGLLGRVFGKGETDGLATGASGLGLAIVRSLVEAHGGTVSVQSEEGRGATFMFMLPGVGTGS